MKFRGFFGVISKKSHSSARVRWQLLRHEKHCLISAEIGIDNSQTDLRILLYLQYD